jgi:hypothetical protein
MDWLMNGPEQEIVQIVLKTTVTIEILSHSTIHSSYNSLIQPGYNRINFDTMPHPIKLLFYIY